MATFKSKAFLGGNIFRQTEEGPAEVSATIFIPSGTTIAASDVFQFMKVGANQRILEATLDVDDLDTGATLTLDLGTNAPIAGVVPANIISASTIGQAGGQVRVENGGSTAFAGGVLAASTEVLTIQARALAGPAGSPATDRRLTLTLKLTKAATSYSGVPYSYRNRYSSAGVGTV